jgi:hypothetical protein
MFPYSGFLLPVIASRHYHSTPPYRFSPFHPTVSLLTMTAQSSFDKVVEHLCNADPSYPLDSTAALLEGFSLQWIDETLECNPLLVHSSSDDGSKTTQTIKTAADAEDYINDSTFFHRLLPAYHPALPKTKFNIDLKIHLLSIQDTDVGTDSVKVKLCVIASWKAANKEYRFKHPGKPVCYRCFNLANDNCIADATSTF